MKIVYPLKRDKYITQHFGENSDYYSQYSIGGVKLKGHEGIDLRARTGTEVIACDAGFCQEVEDQGKVGYGKYIKLVHPWGESVYAHLSEFKIKAGAEVKKGQPLGLSGNTGNSTGPHLHFAMRINPYNRADGWGGYSDPEPYLFDETSTELDMPSWAKKLQPFFIENNLKEEQIEPEVRQAFGDRKILSGFVAKWVEKFNLKTDEADMGHVEKEVVDLMVTEGLHEELVSACEQLVGQYETEDGLRNALRALKKEIKVVADRNTELEDENTRLKKRRTLDRYTEVELTTEIYLKLVQRFVAMITKLFKKKK